MTMRLLAAIVACAVSAAACSGDAPDVIETTDAPFVPVIETHKPAVGDDVIVFTLLDRDRRPSFAADVQFRARFFEPTEGGVRFRADAEAVERVELAGGDYFIARGAPLDRPGNWALAVTAAFADGTSQTSPRLSFSVFARPNGPAAGEPAPREATPSTVDAGIDRLTADDRPLARLYERSADQLIGSEPFVILFATPARCAGRPTCARALEQLKRLGGGIAAIHVEPFPPHRGAELQPTFDAAVAAWQIESEPIFFFVDGGGVVRARIQAVATDAELGEAAGALR